MKGEILSIETAEELARLRKENEELKEKVYNQRVANAYQVVQIDKLEANIRTKTRRRSYY